MQSKYKEVVFMLAISLNKDQVSTPLLSSGGTTIFLLKWATYSNRAVSSSVLATAIVIHMSTHKTI